MEFIFEISPYNVDDLTPQLSLALEKGTEFASRQACPNMWNITDHFNSRPKAPEKILKKRRSQYRIYGSLLLMMGIFLLIPGLMEPKELLWPLVMGVFSVVMGIFAWTMALYTGGRRKNDKRFVRAARKLLERLQTIPSVKVRFTQDGMKIADKPPVPYEDLTGVIETQDLFLILWNKRGTVLQKQDMIEGNAGDFAVFIKEQAKETEVFAVHA